MERINFRIAARCFDGGAGRGGFTIVEMLIAMVIFSVALTAIYASYLTQQKTYIAQTEVAAMQQSIRVAMYHLERELRMAGFDPRNTANAGFTIANADQIQFTADSVLPSNGLIDSNERIRYAIGGGFLRREAGGSGLQALAKNIEVIDFVYLDEGNNVLNPNLGDVSPNNLKEIRSVQVTMVATVDRPDGDYRRSISAYANQQGETILVAPDDHKRRRSLTSTIRCRNMGL
jgi:type IV pilus assembly protein PilW